MMQIDDNALRGLETILDFWRYGVSEATRRDIFFGHGTDCAEADIRTLILGSLSLPYDVDPLFYHARLTVDEKALLAKHLSKRLVDRVPVPYIIHEAMFAGMSFYVDERVLIPRSPIVELIEQQFSPWVDPSKVHRILDVCTGSACLAIACQYAFPEAQVDALDISPDALEVAQINVEQHHMPEIGLIQSDLFDTLPQEKYSIIIANPPYVSDEEMATLPEEYHHEPSLALRADNAGLALVARILSEAKHFLTDEGILVVEVGFSQEAVMAAYPDYPFVWLTFERGGQGVFLLTHEQLRAHT